MHLTRRYFLKSTGAVVTYLGVAPMLPRVAMAGLVPQRVAAGKTLVVIFLRGGADGLNLVVPHAEPDYYKIRKSIAIPAPGADASAGGAIDLDGFFGLNPRMGALKPLFNDGTCIAAHAVGYDKNTRSHFEEQDAWETGVAGNTINSDGWLNRHLATSEGTGPIRAVSIGDNLPRIMQGKASAIAIRGMEDLTLSTGRKDHGAADPNTVAAALEHAYCCKPGEHAEPARDLLSMTAGTTLEGIKQLREMTKEEYRPAAEYPKTDLARKLAAVARLIKSNVGLEVAEVDLGGFDTHQNQGRGSTGTLGDLAQQLADAIAAFNKDLGDRMNDTLVVTLTDFGRTAAENGTQGTDHGWANCMFLAGGAVKQAQAGAATPKKVLGRWPGLAPDQLHQGRDLLHTTDFRDVLGEVVSTFLGNPNIKVVLPEHDFKPVGLIA